MRKRGAPGLFLRALSLVRWVVGGLLTFLGFAGIPDNVKVWLGWLAKLEPYIDSYWIRVPLFLVGACALTYPQWLPYFTRTSKRDVSFIDGVCYVVTRSWGDVTTECGISPLGSALDHVLQRAADGDVAVWGKVSRYGAQFVRLPKEYWHTARIDLNGLLKCATEDDHERLGTEQSVDAQTDGFVSYCCLRLTKSEIETLVSEHSG